MTTRIYHNPNCGTSRNVLALIRNSGEEPEVIEYLKTPPSRERLVAVIAAMGIPVRDLLRRKGTPYDELWLDDPKFFDGELIDLMLQHPILINRPVVETPLGTRLCRPSEAVLEILPKPQQGEFRKEDGELDAGQDARGHAGFGRLAELQRRQPDAHPRPLDADGGDPEPVLGGEGVGRVR